MDDGRAFLLACSLAWPGDLLASFLPFFITSRTSLPPYLHTQPFHAYEEGNLNFLAAAEVESATSAMCLRVCLLFLFFCVYGEKEGERECVCVAVVWW